MTMNCRHHARDGIVLAQASTVRCNLDQHAVAHRVAETSLMRLKRSRSTTSPLPAAHAYRVKQLDRQSSSERFGSPVSGS
jgi:hypothetical protein